MKVWITKHALTSGIFTVGNAEVSESSPNMISFRTPARFTECYHGNDWHTTWESAKERAEEMRAKKLKSIAKQTEKILYMEFENPDEQHTKQGEMI